jgi:hypothetical protein
VVSGGVAVIRDHQGLIVALSWVAAGRATRMSSAVDGQAVDSREALPAGEPAPAGPRRAGAASREESKGEASGVHFPDVAVNELTSGWTDDVTSCPEYKVTAVSVQPA